MSDLTLSVFLYAFRRQLIDYRKHPGIDVATPGEVLDAVVRSLDRALQETKAAQASTAAKPGVT